MLILLCTVWEYEIFIIENINSDNMIVTKSWFMNINYEAELFYTRIDHHYSIIMILYNWDASICFSYPAF